MLPRYDPHGVEERWQATWEAEGLYNADPDPARVPFVDAHPPPNVTGELHTGHALQLALGDTVIRMKRMQGYNTLFQPGYDHAGISTQNVVENVLVGEGTSRQELGREAFEERVWDWLHEYGGRILGQFRRMGASLDYRRTRFTMDDAVHPRGDALLRAPLPARLDLPGESDHQLVPASRDVALRPRARARRRGRHPLDDSLPARRRRRATSRSRPSGRRRSPPTSPSPCTPTTTGTGIWSGVRS